MTVTFYNFSKRRNSTATPVGGTDITNVRLKDNTSKYNPVFHLTGDYPSFTYAYWNGLYYYVRDIVSVGNGRYEIECELDPMGSAASDILSMNAFVNRSASDYEINLKDVEVSAKQNVARTAIEQTTLGLFDGTGCYILRVIGNNSGASGIATYAVTEAELNTILNFMFDDTGSVWDSAWDSAIKAIFNPFQYIVSLRYTPIAKTTFDNWGSLLPVNFGWWTGSGGSVRCIDRTGSVYPSSGSPISLTIPTRYFNDFRDFDPEFTDFKLTLPGGNTVTLPSIWLSLSSIKISIVYDFVVGDSQIFLHGPSGDILASFSFKCSEEIQIGQQSANMATVIGDAAGAVGSFMAGNPIGVGISSFGAISNILQPSPSLLSKNGGMQSMVTYRDPVVSIVNYESSGIATTALGRPLNETRSLSSLSGFCKCSNASVDTDLPAQYKDEINNMLNTGFYIE